jgi:hypothetical protein
MALSFTIEKFYGVFRDYNTSMWSAQWFLVAMAVAAVAALRPRSWSGIALAYYLAFFTRISPAAYAFAALSMVGAAAFYWTTALRSPANAAQPIDRSRAVVPCQCPDCVSPQRPA